MKFLGVHKETYDCPLYGAVVNVQWENHEIDNRIPQQRNFDCDSKMLCGIAQQHGMIIHFDWDSCPRKVIWKKTGR